MKLVQVILLFLATAVVQPTLAAFGDRIRPITPNPLYFRGRNKSLVTTVSPTRRARFTTPLTTTTTTTTAPQPVIDDGSPEPEDDDISVTPINMVETDSVYSAQGNDNSEGIYPDYLEEDEGAPYRTSELLGLVEKPSNSTATTDNVLDYDVYPPDPPQSLLASSATASRDNISSSDSYDNPVYHYAAPPRPRVNPYDINKVVLLTPPRPQPGYDEHLPVLKKVIDHRDIPVYRDRGPRIRYIKKNIDGGPYPYSPYRYPINHHYLSNLPPPPPPRSRKLPHPHEYDHHPHHDADFYGYIPGIPGRPWKDYPLYSSIPQTEFTCKQTRYPGFYADVDAGCQVWHYCQLDGRHDKFLCPNGTVFDQKTRVCDWWYNVDCPSSIFKYAINADLYRTKTIKKVLHIHPGKKPHVDRIPSRGKGVYVFTELGGRSRPISLSQKVHKHHFLHHPHHDGRYPLFRRSHPITRSMFDPDSQIKPHFIHRLPKVAHHHRVRFHDHRSIEEALPVPGARHTLTTRRIRVRKVMIPRHSHHFDTVHHLPLVDEIGRIPHHGHLILHHHHEKKA